MLESLTDRFAKVLRNLRGIGKLNESNMGDALKEVRTALLSADVHFKVARRFVEDVKEACEGSEVIKSITPGQQVIKIIHDELVKLLGQGSNSIAQERPLKVMLVGLHGAGKTTCSVKLARYLKREGYIPAVVACDVYRPAAIDQLETLAAQESFLFYADRTSKDVPKISRGGLEFAKSEGADAIIYDTAGRLHIDEELVQELKDLCTAVSPDETLLVADSALGQEAVNVARTFHDAVSLTGIVLTKLDGDARGGAALSMKAITGVPIKFIGTGEKVVDFDVFHPDRMASRILGMGDVVSLVEKAQDTIDQEEAVLMAEKFRRADFDLSDLLGQLRQIKKMGSISSVMELLPGMSGIQVGDKEDRQMVRTEAIILSMSPKERASPQILNGSRRKRIAQGSGVQVREVNSLLKQFQQMRKMMRSMKGKKGKRMMQRMGGLSGKMPGMPF